MCADDAKNEEDAAIIMSAVQRITELEQRIRELEQQLAASREVCADYVRSFSELEQQLEYWKQECNHRIAQLAQMTAEREKNRWIPVDDIELLKTGDEIIVMNTRQGGVKALIYWDRVHECWKQKGEAMPSFQHTHYLILPTPEAEP